MGGFRFGVGSLIMPINIDTQAAFSPMARSIAERLKTMTDEVWTKISSVFLVGIPSGIYYFLRYGRGDVQLQLSVCRGRAVIGVLAARMAFAMLRVSPSRHSCTYPLTLIAMACR